MRKPGLLNLIIVLGAISLSSAAIFILFDRNISVVEFLFVAMPIMFILFLFWQASKYYIIVSEDDAREWDGLSYPESKDTTVTVTESKNSRQTDEKGKTGQSQK